MINALFFKGRDGFSGFEISGHSGLAEHGSDIVCAAVSSMSQLVINTAREIFNADLSVSVRAGDGYIRALVDNVRLANEDSVRGLIEGFFKEMEFIAEDYPENVRVAITQEEN